MQHDTSEPVSEKIIEDIQNAYRWVLGRQPTEWEQHARLTTLCYGDSLRLALLHSAEFLDQVEQHQLLFSVESINFDLEDVLPENHSRTIVIDVPLAGTHCIRRLILDGLRTSRQCPEDTNQIALRTALNLGVYDLFIGTYDNLSLNLIPGLNKKIVVMLAEPEKRLVALHHHLSACDQNIATQNQFELCKAARTNDLGEFLEAALQINASAVDNIYARMLGGQISKADWRKRATPTIPSILTSATENIYMERAQTLLNEAFVGLLEYPHKTRDRLRKALHIECDDNMLDERYDEIVYQGGYNWIPPIHDEKAAQIVRHLTRLDQKLYQRAVSAFTSLDNSE